MRESPGNYATLMLRNSRDGVSLRYVKASELEVSQPAIVSGLILDVMSGRLMSLGVRKGARIQKLRKTTGGAILFRVEDHRVVLHRSLAELVEVREEI
jgi:Fe2+ transport system protein FeoA